MYAVILAGGLSRRLGGVPKAGLQFGGQSLLLHTVLAVSRGIGTGPDAGEPARIAVVGPVENTAGWLGPQAEQVAARVVLVQEDPPFSGPAAGVAAGLDALASAGGVTDAGHVLVLACDMPRAPELVTGLLARISGCGPAEGVMAVDRGRRQPLAGIYPHAALWAAVNAARAADCLRNASVFSLLATVKTKEWMVPAGLTADIDTWEDAQLHGIPAPH